MEVRAHRRCRPTARRLRASLAEVDGPTLNWGTVETFDGPVVNSPDVVRRLSNKRNALAELRDAGVSVPQLWMPFDGTPDPTVARWIGRSSRHTRGSNIWVCSTEAEMLRAIDRGATHFTEFIEAPLEFRVHVIDGKVIKTSQKVGGEGWVRTSANGWQFLTPRFSFEDRKPIRRLARAGTRVFGADIVAWDIMFNPGTGQAWILEGNTAPGMADETSTLRLYVKWITETWATQPEPEPTPSRPRRRIARPSSRGMERVLTKGMNR